MSRHEWLQQQNAYSEVGEKSPAYEAEHFPSTFVGPRKRPHPPPTDRCGANRGCASHDEEEDASDEKVRRVGEAARGSRCWSQLLSRRSPTLPDVELSSMLQSYLDESATCQQQQQHNQNGSYQLRKFGEASCQENFSSELRNKNKINSTVIGNKRSQDLCDSEREEEVKLRMNYLPFNSQHSPENVSFSNQTFPNYCSVPQTHLPLQQQPPQVESCYPELTNRSLLLLPNVSPSSMDSGYGGPGSVGSLHSSSSTSESPMHSGSSFPSSPWTGQNQDYLSQNSPYMYSYETTTTAASNKPSHIYESSNALQKIERNQIHSFSSQPSHYCSDNNIADSLTAVNYFIPSSQTGHPNSDFVHLEEDTQFGFGGCSQEEISNLVDQVLSSIDAFPTTTDVQVECDNRQTSGTLCQDCGNFVEIETSPNDLTHLFCQHCGASIDFDRQSVDENSSQAVNVNDESSNTIMW